MPSRGYFADGGFTVGESSVTVKPAVGRRQTIDRSAIQAVVLTDTAARGTDWRVLLVDEHDRVLMQDLALYYEDADVTRLAQALGVPALQQSFGHVRDLAAAHPGAISSTLAALSPRPITALLIPVLIGAALLTAVVVALVR